MRVRSLTNQPDRECFRSHVPAMGEDAERSLVHHDVLRSYRKGQGEEEDYGKRSTEHCVV